MSSRDLLALPTWQLLDAPVLVADCVEAMRAMPDASVDAVCTDPPYGIGFMGHDWDQPGEYGPVRANGQPAAFASGRPSPGPHVAGGARRTRVAQPAATGFGAPPKRFGGPTGMDNTTHVERGGAMHAGRYDLSTTANRRFQAWCEEWAREALRVLKPGGHLLVFGSTRTYHRLAAGVEDAGFEIRDTLAWMFGSGFPKSLDVSKAVDRLDAAAERDERAKRSQSWLRQHVTPQQVNAATDTDMGHHLTTHPTQPFVPTPTMLDQLRPLLPEVPAWLEQIVRDRAVESANMAAREVVAEREGTTSPGFAVIADGEPTTWDETRPHTPEAQAWEGWGTALKPAFEPIVVARKPLAGTVAANVLEHGTGALNVDGCRVGAGNGGDRTGEASADRRYTANGATSFAATPGPRGGDAAGRWPANVVLDLEAAALLDEQTGELSAGVAVNRNREAGTMTSWMGTRASQVGDDVGYGDTGGASRFFYCAKVSTAERSAGLDGFEESAWTDGRAGVPDNPRLRGATGRANHHPTVKPIELMRWLIRLVTPPDGVVLDPFTGSGTTGCAAALERVQFVGIERDPDYARIASARIAWWREHPEGLEIVAALTADAKRRAVAQSGQASLFDQAESTGDATTPTTEAA